MCVALVSQELKCSTVTMVRYALVLVQGSVPIVAETPKGSIQIIKAKGRRIAQQRGSMLEKDGIRSKGKSAIEADMDRVIAASRSFSTPSF